MSTVYITSDLHLGHSNIHEKFRTEFISEQHHNEHIVDCWNSVVKKRDVVKVLGDFVFNRAGLPYLKHLNGTIHLISGNHDIKWNRDLLNEHRNLSYVVGAQKYKGTILTHIPIHPDEMVYRSWKYNIHGHVHNKDTSPEVRDSDNYYNVNVDVNSYGFFPIPFEHILMETQWKI